MNPALQSIRKFATAALLTSLASCSGSNDLEPGSYDNTPSGTITVWADDSTTNYCGNIRVSIDGIDLGVIPPRVTAPKCGDFSDPKAFSKVLPEGGHILYATDGTCIWEAKNYIVTPGSCTLIVLTDRTPFP